LQASPRGKSRYIAKKGGVKEMRHPQGKGAVKTLGRERGGRSGSSVVRDRSHGKEGGEGGGSFWAQPLAKRKKKKYDAPAPSRVRETQCKKRGRQGAHDVRRGKISSLFGIQGKRRCRARDRREKKGRKRIPRKRAGVRDSFSRQGQRGRREVINFAAIAAGEKGLFGPPCALEKGKNLKKKKNKEGGGFRRGEKGKERGRTRLHRTIHLEDERGWFFRKHGKKKKSRLGGKRRIVSNPASSSFWQKGREEKTSLHNGATRMGRKEGKNRLTPEPRKCRKKMSTTEEKWQIFPPVR